MVLESNVDISSTSSTTTTLSLEMESPQFASLEQQKTAAPLSRKRKLFNQHIQQTDHEEAPTTVIVEQCAFNSSSSNCLHSTSSSASYWLEQGSFSDGNIADAKYGRSGDMTSSGKSSKLDYLQQQQQQQTSNALWPNEKSEWESTMPFSLSNNHHYQPSHQYHSPENDGSYQQQQSVTALMGYTGGHFLEHAGTTATPAFLDWSTTLHSPSEHATDRCQCLNHSDYSARSADINDDGGTYSASLGHKHQLTDHATPMHSIDDRYPHPESQQQQNNDMRQKCQQPFATGLTLDLKDLSNMPTVVAQADSPMTPALFSPSFIDALDDICMTITPPTMTLDDEHSQQMDMTPTAPTILPTTDMSCTSSSATGSHFDWHSLNQQHMLVNECHYNSLHLTQAPDVSSGILSEQNVSIISEPTTTMDKEATVYQSNPFDSTSMADFNGLRKRRPSNNSVSTNSSISDTLVTPKFQAHISPMQAFGQAMTMLHQYQQNHQKKNHQISIVPSSLEMKQTTAGSPHLLSQPLMCEYENSISTTSIATDSTLYSSHGNAYYNNSKLSLAVLEEEEENRVLNQQQQRRQLENSNKLSTAYSAKLSIHDAINNYLSRTNVTTTGELTVMISTSKVAQKSYGTEKRFLCPPPSITLIGADWWTRDILANAESDDHTAILRPPMVQIQISNDSTRSGKLTATPIPPGSIEWITLSGIYWNEATRKAPPTDVAAANEDIDEDSKANNVKGPHLSSASSSSLSSLSSVPTDVGCETAQSIRMNEPIVSGRCVSKNMYISDTDEKRKTVEMLIRLQLANGLDLGVFKSKDIKVISKPSKKRQSLKNMELCVHHGSTVALFNRIRSQTVSTRYLCISGLDGSPVCYGNQQQATWIFNNEQKEIKNVCFSAKTDSWDSFLIWIVDGSRTAMKKQGTQAENHNNSQPTWPLPPAMAMQSNDPGTLLPVYYNQPVVLQCINTGLVSPVMIIRKVDFGNMAIGGMRTNNGPETHHSGSFGAGGEYYDEDLGDPVSQLHKVAFQVVDDTISLKGHTGNHHQQQDCRQQQYRGIFSQSPATPFSLPYSTHPAKYLSCMKDLVGIYRTSGQRSQIPINIFTKVSSSSSSPSPSPSLPSSSSSPPSSSMASSLSSSVQSTAIHTDSNGKSVQQSSPAPHTWHQPFHINDDYRSDYTQQHRYHQHHQEPRRLQFDESPLSQKRRVSCDEISNHTAGMDWMKDGSNNAMNLGMNERVSMSSTKTSKTGPGNRRRYSSANEQTRLYSGGGTLPRRRNSILSSSSPSSSLAHGSTTPVNWQEEISETCIFSIVNTDTATYTFWPSGQGTSTNDRGFHRPVAPVPYIKQCKLLKDNQMVVHGCGFTNDMVVWFGSFASTMLQVTPIKLELLVPNILLEGDQLSRCIGQKKGNDKEQVANGMVQEDRKGSTMKKVPILLVREGDGIVYRTQTWF